MPASEPNPFFRRRATAWLAAGLLLCAGTSPVRAKDMGKAAPFRLSIRLEVVEGFGARQRAFVTSGTNEFCLLLPKAYGASLVAGDSLVLAAPDNLTFVSVTRVAVGLPRSQGPSVAECRSALLATYPGAAIQQEFFLGAGDQRGPAFDLVWSGATRRPKRIRVAYVPGRFGVLRFTLATTEERFSAVRLDLNSVMATYMAGQTGRLDVPPLSNRF